MNRIFVFLFSLPIVSYSANFTIPNGDVNALSTAIQTANGNNEADSIFLATGGTYSFTAVNNSINGDGPNAMPAITNDLAGLDLVIIGNGATLQRTGAADIRALYLNGGPEVEIYDITFHNFRTSVFKGGAICAKFQGAVLTVAGCTFTDNVCAATGAEDGGGAIRVHQADLTILSSTFLNNSGNDGGALKVLQSNLYVADSYFQGNQAFSALTGGNGGGAISVDGAKGNTGTADILRCEFMNNFTFYQGGALMLFFYDQQTCDLEDCLFETNRCQKPSPVQGPNWGSGGAVWLGGTLVSQQHSILGCTFSGNRADKNGGGLYFNRGTLDMENCTVYNNEAVDPDDNSSGQGGGIYVQGNSGNTIADFQHLTISENNAGFEGGGVRGGNTNLTFTSSIIANNTANNPFGNKQNCADNQAYQANPGSYFSDGGNNLEFPAIGNTTNNGYGTTSGSLNTIDPLLGGLALNGGFTPTMSILAGSAAIDGGANCLAEDQRGFPRVGTCDIGAFEFGASVLPLEWGKIWLQEEPIGNRLHWTTFNEVNTYRFDVEKSIAGRPFSKLGDIPSFGTGDNLYTWLDPNRSVEIVQYRIKQWDIDGGYSYSTTVEIFPDPVPLDIRSWRVENEQLVVELLAEEEMESSLQLVDLTGRILWQASIRLKPGTLVVTIPVHSLSSAVYLLRLHGSEKSMTRKIIIQ